MAPRADTPSPLAPAAIGQLLFSFDGRIARRPFWIAMIAIGLVGLALDQAMHAFVGPRAAAASSLVALYPTLAVAAKRAHDRGRSELVLLVFYLPAFAIGLMQVAGLAGGGGLLGVVDLVLSAWLVGAMLIMAIDLGLLPGESGANAHGPDPRG